jgi:hypothetical protein
VVKVAGLRSAGEIRVGSNPTPRIRPCSSSVERFLYTEEVGRAALPRVTSLSVSYNCRNGPVARRCKSACYWTANGPVAQLVERGAYTFVYTYSIRHAKVAGSNPAWTTRNNSQASSWLFWKVGTHTAEKPIDFLGDALMR